MILILSQNINLISKKIFKKACNNLKIKNNDEKLLIIDNCYSLTSFYSIIFILQQKHKTKFTLYLIFIYFINIKF